jgi:hypothetical protein
MDVGMHCGIPRFAVKSPMKSGPRIAMRSRKRGFSDGFDLDSELVGNQTGNTSTVSVARTVLIGAPPPTVTTTHEFRQTRRR